MNRMENAATFWQKNMPEAYAYHHVVTNEAGEVVDYVFLQVNPAFEKMTGLKEDAIVGKRVTEVLPGITEEEFDWIGTFGRVALTGEGCRVQQYSAPLNRWYNVIGYSDTPGYFAVLFHDITEPQQDKEKLHDMMQFSQRFLDTEDMPDIQEITEFMRRITGASYAVFNQFEDNGKYFTTKAIASSAQQLMKAAEIIGFNPVGKKWLQDPNRQFMIQDKMVTVFDSLQVLTGKAMPAYVALLVEKSFNIGQVAIVKTMKKEKALGDFTLMMPKGIPMKSQELAILFATQVGLHLDRIQHEHHLKESEEKHRRLFETMSPGVIYQDAEGAIISANPAAERMIGITFDQMQGKTSIDPRWKMIKGDGSPVIGTDHPSMIALRTGKKIGPVTRGVYIPERDKYVWLSITAIPLFKEGEEKPFQVYAVFDDFTDLKEKEEALKLAKQQAEAANKAKSRYLAHMNHEIRTPLNGFMGFLQLMEDTMLDEEQQEFMDYMKLSTNHMLSIINNVLDMAKIEAGEMQLINRVFHLEEEIQTALAPLHALATRNNTQLEVTLDENLPLQVEGDPDRLRQITLNVGGNAVKFTEEGKVSLAFRCIDTDEHHHTLQILVVDTGPGMSQDTLDKLFMPFYQGDDGSKIMSKGTGLGLAITRELVELMDGKIKVESAPGEGTRMEVQLKLAKVRHNVA